MLNHVLKQLKRLEIAKQREQGDGHKRQLKPPTT